MINNDSLAILGGKPTFDKPLERYNSFGEEELNAANEVLRSGKLSYFLASWNEIPNIGGFYGGPKVQLFERLIEKHFNVKHAVTVNSWTSGLIAAVGAIGIEPGDEVIVTPWTMCASATAILHWNAIPVFVDIEDETFNINPDKIEEKISEYTKAIMVVDIFGQSADMEKINRIAKKYNLKVISDTAQAPNAMYKNHFAGTIADIGGFSLNFHKHIHTGEGGILVTNDDDLAKRLQLIRNHGETIVDDMGVDDISNMIGYNFRLGEIEAAIGIEQLKKIDKLVERRVEVANKIREGLSSLKGLRMPILKPNCTHSYYAFPLIYDKNLTGVDRKVIYDALKAEGIPTDIDYPNLHMLPMYQRKIAYGKKGFPWSSDIYKGNVDYSKGICPVAEMLVAEKIMIISICDYEFSDKTIDMYINGFKKIWSNLDKLKSL